MNTTRSLRPTLLRSSTLPVTTPSHHPPQCLHKPQIRHATLIRRPHRPYTFTQLVTLSDGSTYTHRTTSPTPVYVSTKDTRNTQLWNPSSQKLLNVEADEAGKLRRFREKFGRGWDATAGPSKGAKGVESAEARGAKESGSAVPGQATGDGEEEDDNLMDLISGYGREAAAKGEEDQARGSTSKSEKGKGGQS